MSSDKIACYTFLPWTRKGVAAQIKEKESFGGASSVDRASIEIDVIVNKKNKEGQSQEESVSKSISLFGPGDIIGIDKRTIIRTEPRDGLTNFEPNYLAYIEFSEEDYIWRYTPASPAGPDDRRLRPWLALLVLKENHEFTFKKFNPLNQPLPSIAIATGVNFNELFPPHDEYWAWGHVHTNQLLSGETNIDEGNELQSLVNSNPNLACSRLLSPRKLEPNTKYQAFLVPAYEKGRMAGLGFEAAEIDAIASQQYSWSNVVSEMPFYYNWSFRTGDQGDFEALVRRLEPKTLDSRVGRRLMDIQDPGYAITYDGDDELDIANHKGAIYLEGALRAPQNQTINFIKSDDSDATVKQLADALNLDDDLRNNAVDATNTFKEHPYFVENNVPTSIENDPIITPPIYGKWHKLVNRVESEKSKANIWINHLNLDPRQRTVAGFGTNVIRKNQEDYMDRAWDQFGEILEANRRLIQSQFVEMFSVNLYKKKIKKLSDEMFIQGTFSIHSRVRLDNKLSVGKYINESRLANSMVTAEYIKTARPKGPLTSFINGQVQEKVNNQIFTNVAEGKLTAAPAYTQVNVDADGKVNDFKRSFTTKQDFAIERGNRTRIRLSNFGITPISDTASPINIPNTNSSRNIIEPIIDIIFTEGVPIVETGLKANLTTSFKNFGEIFELTETVYTNYLNESNWSLQEPKPKLSVDRLSNELRKKIDPVITYSSRILNRLTFGDRYRFEKPDRIEPILIAPDFCDPMYKELVKISSEMFLPNLNLIKNNTISILETNPEFIESYMVGLNHEFARELLWREYLTDQRGSYFRQFWDTYSKSNAEGLAEEAFDETKKDIKPIHTWGNSRLGSNEPMAQAGSDKTVLVIRGDLLKKYPNTIIFMQEATFDNPSNPDLTMPRELKDGGEIITPSFEAKIDPDIYFIGFDISVVEARGDKAAQQPGYFFVLQERTGEIHFGMDTELKKNTVVDADRIINKAFFNGVTLANNHESVLLKSILGTLEADSSWNDLAWSDIPGNANHINLSDAPNNEEREGLRWGNDAATMASILYQNPFMMAIHASEMISEDAN